MAAPIINIFESDDATDAAAWDAGTIKAGMTSDARKSADPKKDIKEIHVWNNYNQTTAGSNMIECTVTTLAADGTDKMTSKTGATPVDYEHIQYGWIEVNVNDEKDTSNNPVWHMIGGSTYKATHDVTSGSDFPGPYPIRGLKHMTRSDGTTAVITDETTMGYDPTEDDVIEGGVAIPSGSTIGSTYDAQVCKLKFRVNLSDVAPDGTTPKTYGKGSTANPGVHTYKIRIQGYYL